MLGLALKWRLVAYSSTPGGRFPKYFGSHPVTAGITDVPAGPEMERGHAPNTSWIDVSLVGAALQST